MLKRIGAVVGIFIAAAVVLVFFVVLLSRPADGEKLKELGVIEPDSLYVEVDDVKTRYVTSGDGDQAILFIHGFSSSLYSWRACLEPLSRKYRVIALDLKGFGFSEKPESEYTTGEYVDFVIHFMDALDLDKVTLCGNSMGGGIAWRAALKYPERVEKLILVDAGGYPSTRSGQPFIMKLVRKLGNLPGVDSLFPLFTTRGRIRSSLASAYYHDEQVTERTVDAYYYSMRTEGAKHAVLARMLRPRSDIEEWQSRISELDLPTLIVWGADDTWIPAEDAVRFHEDIAGSHLRIFQECGHLPQEEMPEAFVAAVLDFMSGIKKETVFAQKSLAPSVAEQPANI
jgi:pimeloyl-ACP methyl ester carboxylesterase